jgi:hypothetical protein
MILIPVRLWTRKCKGNCGDESPHDSHLTFLGKLALRLKGRSDPDEEGVYVTKSGRVLTDEDIKELAEEAERGYDPSQIRRRPDVE